MRRALEWLGGSVLVYVLMAACAGAPGGSSSRSEAPTAEGGADGAVAAGGVPNVPATGGEASPGEAGLGGVLDPVPPAMADAGAGGTVAATATWEAVDVPCDGERFDWFNAAYRYGEVLRPGRSAQDLARTVVHYKYPEELPQNQRQLQPPAYNMGVVTIPIVKDGAVAAVCSNGHDVTFTFLIPPPL
jgi:hypothetical protein